MVLPMPGCRHCNDYFPDQASKMASIGHLAAGAAVGALQSRITRVRPSWAILGACALAVAPDLDLISYHLWAGDGDPLAHRGMTHSLVFAVALALIVGLALRRRYPGARAGTFAFLALASHGLMDTLSHVGDGPKLLWPFLDRGIQSPWQPVPGVPTASDYFSIHAIPTFLVEAVVFSPLVVAAILLLMSRDGEGVSSAGPDRNVSKPREGKFQRSRHSRSKRRQNREKEPIYTAGA